MNLINPLARQMWYQYHSKKHKIISHLDQAVKDKTSKQSFTSLLYMHDNWEDSWGGELTFLNDKQSILPKPNRLIIYSRDEEHWVNEITHDLDDYQRMLFFTAWGTDNDF
jgi:Rps23 Pro-64 3,4-dihydroxylase Tpa1-like proline 4-hydroxylase